MASGFLHHKLFTGDKLCSFLYFEEGMETKADVNVLMEGIRCQQDDIPSLKQALLTLASMCNANGKYVKS